MKTEARRTKRAASGKAVELRDFNCKQADRPLMRQLYRRAQAQLRKQRGNQEAKGAAPESEVDTRRLLHELQVHQIELEMQNGELEEAQERLEAVLADYTDLYDFAPAGYLSLNEQGEILKVNLTGAALLGAGRLPLVSRPLLASVAPEDRAKFLRFLNEVFASSVKPVCEVKLLSAGGASFWACIHGAVVRSASGPKKSCRLVISDISALKMSEEAQRRVEVLADVNRDLLEEIARRRAVEESLKISEQHQVRLLAQSNILRDQLRHLSRSVLRAQEEERKRVSRELHDVVAQALTGINVHLAGLEKQARHDPKGLNRSIARTRRLVEKSADIVQQFARELRPTALDDLGLIPALHSFMKTFAAQTGLRTHLTVYAGVEQLDADQRTVLYRVAQEALMNVARHAQASSVKVSILKAPHSICLKIKDDGKSFRVQRVTQATNNQHLGLLGMRERLEMVGGRLSVHSISGKGTIVEAQIPRGNPGCG